MAELLGSLIMMKTSKPKPLPPVMPKPKPAPEAPKQASMPPTPAKAPSQDIKVQNAGVADERRRILKAMPTKTENTFAGEEDDQANVKKKRLLGSGGSGKQTTGE